MQRRFYLLFEFSPSLQNKNFEDMPTGLRRYFRQILKLLIPALLAVYAIACATIVPPTGGPKDITPPKWMVTI